MLTELLAVGVVGLGLAGLSIASKRRIHGSEAPRVMVVRLKAVPFGWETEEVETAEQREERQLRKAYARMPLRWALTGSWYTSLSPLTLWIMTGIVWLVLILLFPAYFEAYISGAAMQLASYQGWLLVMILFPSIALARTVLHVIRWVDLRRTEGAK